MKWIYFILACALLLIALMQLLGVAGSLLGWWPDPVDLLSRHSGIALLFFIAAIAFFVRGHILSKRSRATGSMPKAQRPAPHACASTAVSGEGSDLEDREGSPAEASPTPAGRSSVHKPAPPAAHHNNP